MTSFEGQMKYSCVLPVSISAVESNCSSCSRHLDRHGILTRRSDGNEWRDGTVGVGFVDGDGTVGADFVDGTGR